jgi:hypothetical protein
MDKRKILVIILTIINALWLLFSLYILSDDLTTGLTMLIPIAIGAVTFLILNKIKKFEAIRALKYANLASILPIGIIIVSYFVFYRFVAQPLAGELVSIEDQVSGQCYRACMNKTQEVADAARACVQNCSNLSNK